VSEESRSMMNTSSQPVDDLFLAKLATAWEQRKNDTNKSFPEYARHPRDLAAAHMYCLSVAGDTQRKYMCSTCNIAYASTAWAVRHLIDVHLDPETDKYKFCAFCNVQLHPKKGETLDDMLDRHQSRIGHQTAVKSPTMSGHGNLLNFCKFEGCGRRFTTAAAGRRHEKSCAILTAEERKRKRVEYLSEEQVVEKLAAHRTAPKSPFPLGPAPWDKEPVRQLTAEEIKEMDDDNRKLLEELFESIKPIEAEAGEVVDPEQKEEEAGEVVDPEQKGEEAGEAVVRYQPENDEEAVKSDSGPACGCDYYPRPKVQRKRKAGTKPTGLKKKRKTKDPIANPL
jgi:hypothetical protein